MRNDLRERKVQQELLLHYRIDQLEEAVRAALIMLNEEPRALRRLEAMTLLRRVL